MWNMEVTPQVHVWEIESCVHHFCVISSMTRLLPLKCSLFFRTMIGDVSPWLLLKGRRKSEEEVQVCFPFGRSRRWQCDDIFQPRNSVKTWWVIVCIYLLFCIAKHHIASLRQLNIDRYFFLEEANLKAYARTSYPTFALSLQATASSASSTSSTSSTL